MRNITDIKELEQGDHVCLLHATSAERTQSLLAFLKDGFSRNECCVYISDDATTAEIGSLLTGVGYDVAQLMQQGIFQPLTKYQTFLRYARFEPILMVELLERGLQQAQERGLAGIRVAAEMTWALGIGCDQLIPFETLLSDYMPRWKATYLCQYNLARFPSHIIKDVLRTHPLAILGEHLCPNVFCEPSNLVLSPENSDARVKWMMGTLKQLAGIGNHSSKS